MRFFLFLHVIFIGFFAGAFTQEDCTAKSFQHRFGNQFYQGDQNYCWAFAAAQLAEDHLCKLKPENCGKVLSRLDISSCNFKLANPKNKQVGHTEDGLKCAFEEGVCEEQYAPYDLDLITKLKLDLKAADPNAALKQILIPEVCKTNRIKLKNSDESYPVTKTVFPFEDQPSKEAFILKAFDDGRSFAAGVCMEKWNDPAGTQHLKRSDCDRHVVIVDAMVWNSEKKSCQLHIRNSIPSKDLTDWVDADRFTQSVFSSIRISDVI